MALTCSKKLSVSLRGITSESNGISNHLNCIHSFRIKKKLNRIKKYVKIKTFVI